MKFIQSIIAVLVLLTASACEQKPPAPPADSRQPTIEKTVTWYNAFLADSYRSLNTEALNRFASTKMVDTVYFHMAAIGEAGVKMDSKLKKITFTPLKETAPNTVEISTKEEWDYTYWDIKTGKRMFDNSVQYSLTYKLEHPDDKWLVSAITVQDTKESKDSSFIFQRPANRQPGAKANKKSN